MSETMPRPGYGSHDTGDPFRAAARPSSRRVRREHWDVLAVIALGGGLGALARYGLGLLVPRGATGFPWPTFVINVTGCFLIGVFMVVITEAFAAHRLVRPFLGVGVLGGYTTFSTYIVDGIRLVLAGDYRTALLYVVGTILATLLAVVLGILGMRWAFRWWQHGRQDAATGDP